MDIASYKDILSNHSPVFRDPIIIAGNGSGTDVDILADGSLDLEDDSLERLDLVLAAVHSRFDLPSRRQTERLLAAIRHPAVHVLAHPTGRLIGRREPLAINLEAVLDCAAEHGVAMELNAHPKRLDLRDTHLI